MGAVQVESVVRRVMWLIKDPQTKILIFSTWAEVLQLLEHALKTNHVPCMRAKSRDALEEAIKEFRKPVKKGRPHLQTLLLLLKQGGNGLNLTGVPASEHAIATSAPTCKPGNRPASSFPGLCQSAGTYDGSAWLAMPGPNNPQAAGAGCLRNPLCHNQPCSIHVESTFQVEATIHVAP